VRVCSCGVCGMSRVPAGIRRRVDPVRPGKRAGVSADAGGTGVAQPADAGCGARAAGVTRVGASRFGAILEQRGAGIVRARSGLGGPSRNFIMQAEPRTTSRRWGRGVVRGLGFDERDRDGGPRVVVVSEGMARVLWPGKDALGECVGSGEPDSPCSEVIGVAEDARLRCSTMPGSLRTTSRLAVRQSNGIRR
jgi:hypothetical protein